MQDNWSVIESLYNLSQVSPSYIKLFQALQQQQSTYTKKEGNATHLCVLFLPYDRAQQLVYLGHHKKANDWIPPGGHLEPGESLTAACLREMQEELNTVITPAQVEPWNLTIKPINRPDAGCLAHYDVWHLVHLPVTNFVFDPREYYDARWFPLAKAPAQIKKNPDFATTLSRLA